MMWIVCLFGGLVVAGCGGRDLVPGSDASAGGVDAGSASGPASPAAPMALRCPSGLVASMLPSGAPTCARDPSLPACAEASARFYDEAACTNVGPACPSGPFAAAPSGDVVYVLAGASGGDGTEARPFGRILDALARARSGTTVLVGKGTYEGNLVLPAGVTLRGACTAETVLTASGIAAPASVIAARGAGSAIESITIGPSSGLCVQAEGASASLTLRGVVVRDGVTVGISVVGATLTGSDVVVRRTRPDPSFGDMGFGVFAEVGATVDLERAVFEEQGDVGVLAVGGSTVTLRRAAVRDGRGAPAGTGGSAVHAQDGSEVVVLEAELAGHGHGGMAAVVNSRLTARDVVIVDVLMNLPERLDGYGIDVEEGSTGIVERAIIAHARGSGITVRTGGTITASDVVVHDTGIGVSGADRVTLDLARVEIAEPASGATIRGPGTTARIADLSLHDTTGADAGGFGLAFGNGGMLTLERAAITNTLVAGLLLNGAGTTATIDDAVVSSTQSWGAMQQWGRGIDVAGGASVELRRVVVEGNHEVQIAVSDASSRLDVTDARLSSAMARPCAETSCRDEAGGTALGAYYGGALTARRFAVDGAALCGVQVAFDATLDAAEGSVQRTLVGACVQVADYDLARVTGTVTYSENGTNVQSEGIYVPAPIDLSGIAPE